MRRQVLIKIIISGFFYCAHAADHFLLKNSTEVTMKKNLLCTSLLSLLAASAAYAAKEPAPPGGKNIYAQENFVANKAKYSPGFGVEKDLVNAWGIAIRPKGAG